MRTPLTGLANHKLRESIEREFDFMTRRHSWKSVIGFSFCTAVYSGWFAVVPISAAPPERPNLNHTADPRPNILPNELYNFHVPYRLRYNRPQYHVGKAMYHVISPTSQEAMVWKENVDAGRYDGHHCPPMYKGYYYPKPWEILNTGPRPNFSTVNSTNPRAVAQDAPIVPAPGSFVPDNSIPANTPKLPAE